MSQADSFYTLVTGASSGIGRAIAVRLSQSRKIILHGRNKTKLEETRRLCHGEGHVIWTCDLAQVENLQADFESFVVQSGCRIESFVHCAGMVYLTAIKTIDLPSYRRILDTNSTSAILLLGSLMKRRIAGASMKSVVFVSSIAATQATRGKSLYGASKGILNSFVRASAVELAPNVRINSVCPAAVHTEMADDVFHDPEAVAAMNRRHPLGTGKPDDVAGVVAFLLSEDARWITGSQVMVDGGASCDLTFK
ncbi:MAG: SDR family oxidoreductase [Kiritimatiellae bacterium]|nr:SDR family oxidoreductase [Kiritimatiellia bacterium]